MPPVGRRICSSVRPCFKDLLQICPPLVLEHGEGFSVPLTSTLYQAGFHHFHKQCHPNSSSQPCLTSTGPKDSSNTCLQLVYRNACSSFAGCHLVPRCSHTQSGQQQGWGAGCSGEHASSGISVICCCFPGKAGVAMTIVCWLSWCLHGHSMCTPLSLMPG